MKRVSDIDLKLLRVFVAVVEAGGFSPAQSLLNIGTSTISLHMTELEQRLGFRLCTRGRRGFGLTERGRVTHQEARRILGSLDDFSSTMASLKKRLAGNLRIGIVDSMVSCPEFPVVRAINRFNQLDNDVHIELTVDARPELERDVIAGTLHVAISPFVRKIGGLNHRPLYQEIHRLYCGRGHPLFGRGDVARGDIERQRFVLRTQQESWDTTRIGTANWSASANSMECMVMLILSGGYVGFLADHYAAAWVAKGELQAVASDEFLHVSEHALVTSTTHRMSSAVGTLFSILADDISAWKNSGIIE